MAQWAVRLTETVFLYRELTIILDGDSLAEARNQILARINGLSPTTGNLVDLRQYTLDEDYTEFGDPGPIEIVDIMPWPPDTSAPARHLETPSRLNC